VRRLLAALGLFAALPTLAQNPSSDPVDWYLQVENDVVFATDRWYTSGVRLARVSRDVELAITQEIYTPDPHRQFSGQPDRSPTARLLLSAARHFRGASAYQTVGIEAGVRGPAALGRQSADLIHRAIAAVEIDWSRELPNEYDAQVIWTRTQRSDAQSPLGEGLKLHFGTVLGNQVMFGHLGVEYRIGSAGARGLSSPLLRFAATPPLTDSGRPALGWSAYAGGSLRGVARNELLTQDYDPTLPELKIKRGVARAALGVTYAGTWGSLNFSVARDSVEFSGQHSGHGFGSLMIHVSF
jgi:lipid A 3-O-deacylase